MSCGMNEADLAAYHRDGFVVVPSLFDVDEIGRLADFAKNDPDLAAEAYGRKDAAGLPVRLALWNTPRQSRVVNPRKPKRPGSGVKSQTWQSPSRPRALTSPRRLTPPRTRTKT